MHTCMRGIMTSRNGRNLKGKKVFVEERVRSLEVQIAVEQKWGGDEIRLPWGAKEMREMDCQEAKKPRDGDHGEGMDSMGLGMACEDSREGGEMENICSVYLLRSRIHDHNPAAVPTGSVCSPSAAYFSSSALFPSLVYIFAAYSGL